VLTIDLRDDRNAVDAFTAHHRRVWPEVPQEPSSGVTPGEWWAAMEPVFRLGPLECPT
jgi:hypothetical protein